MEQAVRGSLVPEGEICFSGCQIRITSKENKIRKVIVPGSCESRGSLPSRQIGPANSKLFSASQKNSMMQTCIYRNLADWQPVFTGSDRPGNPGGTDVV